jgi:hypothetical protein
MRLCISAVESVRCTIRRGGARLEGISVSTPILIYQPIHLAVGYLDDLTRHERSQIINGFIEFSLP